MGAMPRALDAGRAVIAGLQPPPKRYISLQSPACSKAAAAR